MVWVTQTVSMTVPYTLASRTTRGRALAARRGDKETRREIRRGTKCEM